MADQKFFNGVVNFENHLESKGTFKVNELDLITSTHIATALLGLNPQWNLNFGGATVQAAGGDVGTLTADVLTPVNTLLRLSFALEKVANQTAVVSSAQANQIFGIADGVTGVDVAIDAVKTPFVDKRVARLTGGITGTVTMTAADDLAGVGAQSMILFTGNACSGGSAVLKLTMHTNNGLKAATGEVCETGNGTNVVTKSAAPSDGNEVIVLTDSTDNSTILAGSYIYVITRHDTDQVAVKGCIRTTGGTVAVTFA